MISINIIMKSQYDQFEMRRKTNFLKTKENKRSFVINELKRFSKESQNGIINELKSFERNLKVTNVKSHWIYNGINCLATPEAIEALASNPDILIIGYNREQYLLPIGEKATAADGSKELTYNITKVNADDVWGLGFTGEGVIIAVIDTGVNYNHVDINDHLWNDPDYPYHGYDFANNDNNPMDDHGHGTHCSGTVCGDGTAGSQTGMAPDATLMCLKVLNSSGNGTIDGICDGVAFAVEHGAHIFSMSLGFANGGTTAERIQFRNTMINTLEAGVVGAVAAGNEGDQTNTYPIPNNVRVPGNCPPPWLHPDQTITGGLSCVVCVGSTTSSDAASYFTSKGPVTWQSITGFNDYAYNPGIGLIRPDVCAPGTDIKSLNYSGTTGYTTMSGTSMATPCVAGVMGLMMQKNLELTPAEIDEILENTAVKLSTSKSNTFGSGRIDALEAVNAVVVGPIIFNSYVLNDENGNNDGKLNPGETVSLTVSMENISEEAVEEVAVVMTSNSPYVTIGTSTAIYGNFAVGEIKTIENAFTLTLSADAPATQSITLLFEASSTAETAVTRCNIMVYDYILSAGSIVVDDTYGNNNGILEPGETADLYLFINNLGNEFASSLNGLLSTTFSGLTINSNNNSFGSMYGNQSSSAAYNVTLDVNVQPDEIIIPFTLEISDYNERQTPLTYLYKNSCNVIFDLYDSYGDGWNGASMNVSFSDGTPSQNLTVSSGQSTKSYTIEISQGTTVTLSWTSGSWDSECSFNIYYEDGGNIYTGNSAPSSGVFYTWSNNCSGGSSPTILCLHVDNLMATINAPNVVLTWDASTMSDNYNIYANHELIASNINATSYTISDVEIGDFCYTVTAVCDGIETNPSNQSCVSFSCAAPSYLSLTPMNNNGEPALLLEWNATNSAEQYKIYVVDNVEITTTDTSYLITNIEWNVEYCIAIAAVCEFGEGLPSSTICKSVNYCYIPQDLTAVAAENNSINLSWSSSENAATYNIYRDGVEIVSMISTNNYLDNNLTIGSYCYQVTALCEIGESDFSNEDCEDVISINEWEKNYKIYPNPANNEINITGENIKSIKMYDVLGKIVKEIKIVSQSNAMLNTSSILSGIYIIEVITTDGNVSSQKVVIQH